MEKLAKRLVWDDLRLLRAIAQRRSLPGAAAELSLSASTVFRRLEQMESILEAQVFERHRTGYALTPIGEDLFALAQRVDEDVTDVVRRVAGQAKAGQLGGQLTIATNDIMLSELLTPLFATFARRHPKIRLNVRVGNPPTNLARRDADIAIRATDHPPENLKGIRVGRIVWALYGCRQASRVRGGSATAPLKGATWVTLGGDLAEHGSNKFVHSRIEAESVRYTVDSVAGAAAAIEAGIGVGYLPCLLADARPDLVRLGPLAPALGNDLWLLSHPALRAAPRVRSLIDFLKRELIRLRPRVEGELPRGTAPG